MKKVFFGILRLMVMTAVSGAAVIPGVTATATNEYVVGQDSLSMGAVDGKASNVVDGSGFEEQLGYHYNNGFRGWPRDEEGDYIVTQNGQGTMWMAAMDPLPSITFDLGAPQTLAAIKVWNFNHANEIIPLGFGSAPYSRSGISRLNMGVQTMDIVLRDASYSVITTISSVSLNQATGLDNVDFGQIIDITDTANVRYVTFNILTNYGDAAGQVGLSEVRFYDTVNVTLDAGPDQTVWIVDLPNEPNEVVFTLVGTSTAASTTWFVYPQTGLPFDADDPNDVIIADPNALNTAVAIRAPGVYYFTLVDDDHSQSLFSAAGGVYGPMGRFSGVYDVVKIRVLASETDDGLIGYWPLDGNLNDASGSAYSSFLSGQFTGSPAPVWENTVGISGGKSVRYNGTGSVQITDLDIDPGTAPEDFYPYFLGQMSREFTVSYWCKVDGTLPTAQTPRGLFERGNINMWMTGDAVYSGLVVQPFSSNEYFQYLQGMGSTKITDGHWHFIVLTYDGFSEKLYVDGRLDGQVLQYGTEIYAGSGGNIRIGARGVENLSFVGLIDDVKVYRLAKSQKDIVDAYKSAGASFKTCVILYEGDANGDCEVNFDDLVILAGNWLH
jgi:hypothetical protein